jgi:uncharacterized protein (DUF1697 family)
MSESHVALMRGINVGGKNKLPMKELIELFVDVGCRDVRSYIQSGNVLFSGDAGLAARVRNEVPRRINDHFGYRVPVILRTAKELRDAADRHPFVAEATDTKHLHIGFLAETPADDAITSLDPARSSVDSFEVIGSEVFFRVPGGMARTKLTSDYFDRRLGTIMTVRNWRTVNKLLEMA